MMWVSIPIGGSLSRSNRCAWQNAVRCDRAQRSQTRGIVVLGLDAPEGELAASFAMAANSRLVKGFRRGRTIFGTCRGPGWQGELAMLRRVEMAERYQRLCEIWDQAPQDAG